MSVSRVTLADAPARAVGLRAKLSAYLALTKPRIIELLLVTTLPTMVLAQGGLPPLGLVVATLVGGAFAAGSANALNCYVDRDIDVVMARTRSRPLPAATVSPTETLIFGVGLSAVALGIVLTWVNTVAAAFTLLAVAYYVGVYTLVLKRRTPSNIVWGGAAGCMPVLIGWAAVTGTVGWPAIVLFLVVFYWTPPHFWALAMRFRDDYKAAGVPMLPVVASEDVVSRRVVVYSWVMVGWSLVLVPVASMGWLYAASAVALGAVFLADAYRLRRDVRRGVTGAALRPMRLFHFSVTYLALLFLAVAVDTLLH